MTVSESTISSIREHAGRIYPEECCGFLLGTWEEDGSLVITDAQAVDNVREELKERRYRISPLDFKRAEEAAEAAGKAVVGFYHSHPDHPARPSSTDLEEATFPGYAYVITSVIKGAPGDISAWSLREDRTGFDEEPITVTADKLEAT